MPLHICLPIYQIQLLKFFFALASSSRRVPRAEVDKRRGGTGTYGTEGSQTVDGRESEDWELRS